MKQMNEPLEKLARSLAKYKYVLLVLLFGLALMLFPGKSEDRTEAAVPTPVQTTPVPATEGFDLSREERRLSETLSAVKGAGDCLVLLSVDATEETELAEDGESPLVLSGGSGGEQTVTLRRVYPAYRGAVIVSTGAADPVVKLDLMNAVITYTGLRSDQITICSKKWEAEQ